MRSECLHGEKALTSPSVDTPIRSSQPTEVETKKKVLGWLEGNSEFMRAAEILQFPGSQSKGPQSEKKMLIPIERGA